MVKICEMEVLPFLAARLVASPLLDSFRSFRLEPLIPRAMQSRKLGDQRGHHIPKQFTAGRTVQVCIDFTVLHE